jgi:hypothetical protein
MVPPQDISASSGWAAKARISNFMLQIKGNRKVDGIESRQKI